MTDHPMSILGEDSSPSQRREAALEALGRLTPKEGEATSPSQASVEALLGRVRQRVAHIMARCASVDVFVAAQLGFTSTTEDVEAVYADLQLFCRWHRGGVVPDEGRDLSGQELKARVEVCERLLESESLLANQVNQWLLFLQSRQGTDSALRLFLSQVTAWHAHVKRQLHDIAEGLGDLAQREETGEVVVARVSGEEELAELSDALIDAGELETLPCFTDWVSSHRAQLCAFLAPAGSYERRAALFDRLWRLADLLVIEDAADRPSLLVGLRRDDAMGGAFERLAEVLAESSPEVDAAALDARFAPALGRQALDDEQRAMLWRTLIVAHPDPETRARAAGTTPLDDLWQILVYPHSPLTAVFVIAREVAQRGDDDLRKVFFDCVKSRLMSSLGEVKTAEDLEVLGELVSLFFHFSFFIQTRYFEQLETMLHLYQAQASRFGASSDRLGRDLHRLEIERHRAGAPRATDPKSLDHLPLPVQRHLAREGCYLTFFACHVNHLIAREVVHYVHADNLSRFLKLSELNRQMLEEAMRRVDLGGKKDLVIEVLTHPKCPMLYAGKQLPRLGRHELHRIVQSRSTHSEVKRKAMLQMIRLRGDQQSPGARV